MNKRIFLSVMLVTVLTFGIVDCKTDVEADTWTDVTSLTQLNGTWKGSYTQTQTQEEGILEGITSTTIAEYALTFNATNATTGTMSASVKSTATFSNNITDTQWNSMKEALSELGSVLNEITITIDSINEATHTIKTTMTVPPRPVSLYDSDYELTGVAQIDLSIFQINQYGTKLKNISGETEIIYTKQ